MIKILQSERDIQHHPSESCFPCYNLFSFRISISMNNNYQNEHYQNSWAEACNIDRLMEYLEDDSQVELSPTEEQPSTNNFQGPSTTAEIPHLKNASYQENLAPKAWANSQDQGSGIRPSDEITVDSQTGSRRTALRQNQSFKDKKAFENRLHHVRMRKAFQDLNQEIDKFEGYKRLRTKLQTLQSATRVLTTSEE